MLLRQALLLSSILCISSCGTSNFTESRLPTSAQHLQRKNLEPAKQQETPVPGQHALANTSSKPDAAAMTYNVVVSDVPVQEVLFALARDAKINIDVASGIQGNVTINAIRQTLPQILERISRQVEMRYELVDGSLIVMPDSPYLKTYKIDYVNMRRDAEGGIFNSSQVGGASTTTASGNMGTAANSSRTSISNSSKNHFWERLESNIKDILRETDKIFPEGSSEISVQHSANITATDVNPGNVNSNKKQPHKSSSENMPNASTVADEGTTVTQRSTYREAAAVISNPENGIITVRATAKQHEKIHEFITLVMANAHRQVLIEVTIVEVRLNSQYQQGINWGNLRSGSNGFQLTQAATAALPSSNTGSIFTLDYSSPNSGVGALAASVQLMESFGTVKVLSSPKLSVMNNQTAMLRVVDNYVYFTIQTNTTTNQTSSQTTYTTTPNIVPVGITMSITPQINENDSVLLNLRPSITRLFGFVSDPNPSLANPCAGVANCTAKAVVSQIPETQTREMESVLKIENKQIAVMGGLMQDQINQVSDETPWLGRIPLLGNFFKNRNDSSGKSELVIFIHPIVIKETRLESDLTSLQSNLPEQDFFEDGSHSGMSKQRTNP